MDGVLAALREPVRLPGAAGRLGRIHAALWLGRVRLDTTDLRVWFGEEAVEAGPVEIVDRAVLPGAPIGEGRIRDLLLGLVLGLALGGGGAVLLENLNTSIRRKEEIEGVLGVPGLAVIPQIRSANRARVALPIGANGTRGARAQKGESSSAPALVSARGAYSSEAEAYRTLRTSLLFSEAVRTLRSVVVTSPMVAEGKTTTAANLAVTFAQQGVRVLLMDCDLRRSRLHRVFGSDREPGLTQLLLGQAAVDDAVHGTDVDGLSLLPAGAPPPNPAELLGGRKMRRLMDSLRESFEILIMDSPPLLAAADAAVLATLADGVLLVVRAGGTERAAAEEGMQRLAAVGAHVLGVVLNDPDAKIPKYGRRYYYRTPYATDA